MSGDIKNPVKLLHSQAVANNVRRDAALAVASLSTLTADDVVELLVMLGLDEQVECLKCGASQYVWHLCSTCEGCQSCCKENAA